MTIDDRLTQTRDELRTAIAHLDAARKAAPSAHSTEARALRATIDAARQAAREARDAIDGELRIIRPPRRPAVHYAPDGESVACRRQSSEPLRMTADRDDVTCHCCRISYPFRGTTVQRERSVGKSRLRTQLRFADLLERIEDSLGICTESLERRDDGWHVVGADGEHPIAGTSPIDRYDMALMALCIELEIVGRPAWEWVLLDPT